jgi:hypothetical protein
MLTWTCSTHKNNLVHKQTETGIVIQISGLATDRHLYLNSSTHSGLCGTCLVRGGPNLVGALSSCHYGSL